MVFSPEALFLVVVVGLLLYGWKRLPGAMRDVGKARRILKAESQALRDEIGRASCRERVLMSV